MDKIRRSWALVKASWAVLKADKELALFPIISAICVAIAIAIIGGGFMLVTGDGAQEIADRFDENSNRGWSIGDIVTLFIIYFVTVLIATFFNAALIGATLKRLRGGDPTFRDGLRLASGRIGSIVGYAAIAATVGLVIQLIRSRSDTLGNIGAGILGAAWGVATFLVVPVLVAEDIGPADAFRRSGSLLKKTWGEQIAGNFSLGLIGFLAALAVALVGGLLISLAAAVDSTIAIGGAITLVIIAAAVIAVIFRALNAIYKAAVYEYAADGIAASAFGQDALTHAFVPKKSK
jgi:hypothetical protein